VKQKKKAIKKTVRNKTKPKNTKRHSSKYRGNTRVLFEGIRKNNKT